MPCKQILRILLAGIILFQSAYLSAQTPWPPYTQSFDIQAKGKIPFSFDTHNGSYVDHVVRFARSSAPAQAAPLLIPPTDNQIYDPQKPYEGLPLYAATLLYNKLHPQAHVAIIPDKARFIDPAWIDYQRAVKDYRTSPYLSYTPQQMSQQIRQETDMISQLLKQNPRYIREKKKQQRQELGAACLEGIALGLMTVVAAYTCGLAGCGAGVAYFGGTVANSTLAVTSANLGKNIVAVALLEITIGLGLEITTALYEDLTSRLIKHLYLTQSHYAQLLAQNASNAWDRFCTGDTNPTDQSLSEFPELWPNEIIHEEALVRLHGLIVIKNELRYSTSPSKYDLALLDIINLLSGRRQIQLDDAVFSVPGTDQKTNVLILHTGYLLERTPQLQEALQAIGEM